MNYNQKMAHTFWHKQTLGRPLFPELVWSRPENKAQAGKLLIIGGNLNGFAAVGQAYQASLAAGIGAARVLLPDSLRKTVSTIFPEAEFAPSTPSGSFSQKALAEFLSASAWADGVLLAGDLGKNSETAILLEKFLPKYAGQLTIAPDAAEIFGDRYNFLTPRPNTTLVLNFNKLPKLAAASHAPQAITSAISLLQLIEALHQINQTAALNIMTLFQQNILTAAGGQLSSTKFSDQPNLLKSAAAASVWWLQNPAQTFQALTTSLI
ncbi:MAG: hypothetical protein ACREGA_01540 [Candidatus Saccharimonadales bacterium]